MRPTGPLHMGNYLGALDNWITMQDPYDCYFFVADWHALTSDYENPGPTGEYVRQILIDWLSAGLSPDQSTIFIQSKVPEHTELYLIFSMITPVFVQMVLRKHLLIYRYLMMDEDTEDRRKPAMKIDI